MMTDDDPTRPIPRETLEEVAEVYRKSWRREPKRPEPKR